MTVHRRPPDPLPSALGARLSAGARPRAHLGAPAAAPAGSPDLEVLTRLCLDDAVAAFGLARRRGGVCAAALRAALYPCVRRFAQRLVVFDRLIGAHGLATGARYAASHLAARVAVRGRARVPRSGPLLIVSNHPGLADAAALLAHTPRADVRLLAGRRALFEALPATADHLFFVSGPRAETASALRRALNHLRRGGALVTYPAGRIEPDPALRPRASVRRAYWPASAARFARRVPGVTVVPVIVAGVLEPRWLRHPLVRMRRDPDDRDWLAATMQSLARRAPRAAVSLDYGAPVRPPAGAIETALCQELDRLAAVCAGQRAAASTINPRRRP